MSLRPAFACCVPSFTRLCVGCSELQARVRAELVCCRGSGSQHPWSQTLALERGQNPGVPATSPRAGVFPLLCFQRMVGFKVGSYMTRTLTALPETVQSSSRMCGLRPTCIIGSAGRKIKPAPPSRPHPQATKNTPSPQMNLQFTQSPLIL